MTNAKDIYRSAKILIDQHGDNAENYALDMMQKFLDRDDVAAASTWLMLAQTVQELSDPVTSHKATIH